MQAVLCLSEEIGEEFVIPTDEVEFARAKRPSIDPFSGDLILVRVDIGKPIGRFSTLQRNRYALPTRSADKAVLSK